MDTLGATDAVLPELAGLRGIEQSKYHHLDVHDHTRAVLAETIVLAGDPEPVFGEHAEGVRAVLAVAGSLTVTSSTPMARSTAMVSRPMGPAPVTSARCPGWIRDWSTPW